MDQKIPNLKTQSHTPRVTGRKYRHHNNLHPIKQSRLRLPAGNTKPNAKGHSCSSNGMWTRRLPTLGLRPHSTTLRYRIIVKTGTDIQPFFAIPDRTNPTDHHAFDGETPVSYVV